MSLWDFVQDDDPDEEEVTIGPGRVNEMTCPECGADMVVRTNKQNGHTFLGCSDWPKCEHTISVEATK